MSALELNGLGPATRPRCAELVSERWRGECVFQHAMVTQAAGDWRGALQGCAAAGSFAVDCARHVREEVLLATGSLPADFEQQLVAAVPAAEATPLILDNSALPQRLADQAQARAVEAQAAAETEARAGAASLEHWREFFGKTRKISVTTCQGDPFLPQCEQAAAETLTARWELVFPKDPMLQNWICDSAGPKPPLENARLQWVEGPVLDEAMRTFVKKHCTSRGAMAAPASSP